MKILQVCPKFHQYVASGSTKVAYDISNELARRGHLVTVYTSDMRDKYNKVGSGTEKTNGISVFRFRSIGTMATREMKIFITPKIVSKLRSEIQSFDVVHLHEYQSFQNLIAYHYAKKRGIPYVLQAHGSIPRIGKRFRKWLYDAIFGHRMLQGAAKVIALSEVEAKDYEKAGVPRRKIVIIPNGIRSSEFESLPSKGSFKEEFRIKKDTRIVLYLGRINRIKGLDFLVKAYARIVRNAKHNSKLVIIGPDDGYLHELQALVKSLGIEDGVMILGPLYGQRKLEAYSDADVYVLPSRYETFPVGLLEAAACKKPVVASMVGAICEMIINDVTGFLVEPGDIEQLASSIMSLLEDNRKAWKMGLEGHDFVFANFELTNIIVRLEKVYEAVAMGV